MIIGIPLSSRFHCFCWDVRYHIAVHGKQCNSARLLLPASTVCNIFSVIEDQQYSLMSLDIVTLILKLSEPLVLFGIYNFISLFIWGNYCLFLFIYCFCPICPLRLGMTNTDPLHFFTNAVSHILLHVFHHFCFSCLRRYFQPAHLLIV